MEYDDGRATRRCPEGATPRTPRAPRAEWVRRDSGPVVRPYAVTGGRTEPADGEVLDLIAVVVAMPGADAEPMTSRCAAPPSTARSSPAASGRPRWRTSPPAPALPLGVVRVLLSDLILSGAVTVMRQRPARASAPGNDVLQEILNGLRAL